MALEKDLLDQETLSGEIDALVRSVEEARFRHVAGIDPAPSLVELFDAHGRAAHRKSVEILRAAGAKELAARVAALRAERAQAGEEEAWRAAEVNASGLGPDGPIALEGAQLAMTRERDRSRRLALGRAVSTAAALTAREAAAETRARARAEVELTPDWDRVVEADALLSATEDGYRDVLDWLSRREGEVGPAPRGEMTRADLLYLLSLHRLEPLFPGGMLAPMLERVLAPLRLDLRRVRVDDERRPAQWPGAHAFGSRVSLRRQGGAADWLGLLEAVGQAVVAAYVPPHRRDGAGPHTLGALLAGLLLDRNFVVAQLHLDRNRAADVVRALSLRQLFRLRARAAALRVASEVERGISGAAWHDAHREALTLATAASWPDGLAARDGDASAAAAILMGAARAEHLRRGFVERFDEDWFRNPRSADALGTLLAGGMGGLDAVPLALCGEFLVQRLE